MVMITIKTPQFKKTFFTSGVKQVSLSLMHIENTIARSLFRKNKRNDLSRVYQKSKQEINVESRSDVTAFYYIVFIDYAGRKKMLVFLAIYNFLLL